MEVRIFENNNGHELKHKDQWSIIAKIWKSMRIRWIKVQSHRGSTDYLETGNYEVDSLTQQRDLSFRALELYLPKYWCNPVTGLVKVPQVEVEPLLTKVHRARGHPGGKRVAI